PLIAKFYRPQRWSSEAIQEELDFLQELHADEVPVVPPIVVQGRTLFQHQGFDFALFPRRGGHAPELSSATDLELIGRWLARIHLVGLDSPFQHRPQLHLPNLMRQAQRDVLESTLIPSDYRSNYQALTQEIINISQALWQPQSLQSLRLHGDLHVGNLLLRDQALFFVDFDDCLQGPAMQDIWMLLSGRDDEQQQLEAIAKGYELFRTFPMHERGLIELLRSARIVKHTAWLAKRWQDPAFPYAFPWFTGHQYWSEHILNLREQIAELEHR
ncbi:MAG: serine/threonine protein kinase, partial [Venatoribacter sp.]